MRIDHARSLIAIALLAIAWVATALAATAEAETVVYTVQATLVLQSSMPPGPPDPYELDGATFAIVVTADTTETPAGSGSSSGVASAAYDPVSLTASYSNRPGGAPDVTLAYTGQIVIANQFAPSNAPDRLMIPLPTSFEGGFEIMAGFVEASFVGQDFFDGSGVPALAAFDSSQIGLVTAPLLQISGPFQSTYALSATGITSAPQQSCGDGAISGTELCDVDRLDPGFSCSADCLTIASICGDGLVVGSEECDDGSTTDGDGCSAECTVEHGWYCDPYYCLPSCGDGLLGVGLEQCDDGNLNSYDGCSAFCVVEYGYSCPIEGQPCFTVCGDGKKSGPEECDDGNTVETDACLNSCKYPHCGDGFTHAGVEPCDDGNSSNSDACLNNCVLAVCGDSYIWTGVEQCDDGNTASGDGCSSSCMIEDIPVLGTRGLVLLGLILGCIAAALLRARAPRSGER